MSRFIWNPKLEAKRAALEAEATSLLRADTRRRKAAHQPKPKSTPPSPELRAPGCVPLHDLRRALRSKNPGNGRAGTKSSRSV
jgi:hypothetical protein